MLMNNFFYLIINNCLNNKYKNYFEILNGDWGLGIGDWGLGIGPNPQSPFQNNFYIYYLNNY